MNERRQPCHLVTTGYWVWVNDRQRTAWIARMKNKHVSTMGSDGVESIFSMQKSFYLLKSNPINNFLLLEVLKLNIDYNQGIFRLHFLCIRYVEVSGSILRMKHNFPVANKHRSKSSKFRSTWSFLFKFTLSVDSVVVIIS